MDHLVKGFLLYMYVVFFSVLIGIQCYWMDQQYNGMINDLNNMTDGRDSQYGLEFWMFQYNHTKRTMGDDVCFNNIIDCTPKLTSLFLNGSDLYPDLMIQIHYPKKLDIFKNPALWIGLLLIPLICHFLTLVLVDDKYVTILLTFVWCGLSIVFIVFMELDYIKLYNLTNTGFHNATINGIIYGHNMTTFYNCSSNMDCFKTIHSVWHNTTTSAVIVTGIYPYVQKYNMDNMTIFGIPVLVLIWLTGSTFVKIISEPKHQKETEELIKH